MDSKQTPSKWKNVIIDSLDILLLVGLVFFLAALPFQLVLKKVVPGPIGTYWKEALLGLLIILWLLRTIISRQRLLMRTRLEGAVLIYTGLILLRLLLDRSSLAGWWGFYISIMYLPLFWLVPAVLERWQDGVRKLLILLTGIGTVIALGGLLEFLIDQPLWPSNEILVRQGFADVYVYGTNLRRVYFVLDSPTILANILAMLMPLALTLILVTHNKWGKLGAGIAAILMAACIVVTFSRGIWVASLIGLVFLGLLGGFFQKHKQTIYIVLGVLLVGGAVWGILTLLGIGSYSSNPQGVVELTSQAYQAAPITKFHANLIDSEPDFGEKNTQEWIIQDPIERRDDVRDILSEHPLENKKVEIIYQIKVPEESAIRFAIALSPQVWSPDKGDGVSFQIFVTPTDEHEEGEFVFTRYINPKSNPNDRRWRNFLVDLSPWAGRNINLSLITEAGPEGDWAFDWAGWADLQIVSLQPDYFTNNQTESAVLDHTSSILDWVQDETNRDRLAAWSQSFGAWRTNPIWGTGLGSTGVAALRTHPEIAFVTESQILKALTELGIPGLLVLLYLWFQIGWAGYKTYHSEMSSKKHFMLLGILTSLLIVFIDGLIYQNLEVKQVNAYFWTILGAMAFMSRVRDE